KRLPAEQRVCSSSFEGKLWNSNSGTIPGASPQRERSRTKFPRRELCPSESGSNGETLRRKFITVIPSMLLKHKGVRPVGLKAEEGPSESDYRPKLLLPLWRPNPHV